MFGIGHVHNYSLGVNLLDDHDDPNNNYTHMSCHWQSHELPYHNSFILLWASNMTQSDATVCVIRRSCYVFVL